MATNSVTGELVQRLKQSGFWRDETEGEIRLTVRSAMSGGMTEEEACRLIENTWNIAKGEYGE